MKSYRPGTKRKAAAIRHMSSEVRDLANHTAALIPWADDTPYDIGEGVAHAGKYWRCTTPHTSSTATNWEPGRAPSLWAEIGDPTAEYPEWMPYTVYNTGDKVTFESRRYICKMNNITHSPGDYPAGWEEVT